MERILLITILVLCVVVKVYSRKDCLLKEDLRNELIKQSKCGEPREVFEPLRPVETNLYILPAAVWVKRCVGLCDYGSHSCVATSKRTRRIPVRVSNVHTGMEHCSTYEVEEHLSCGCNCKLSQKDCHGPKIFNPSECQCKCPNTSERKNCLRKRNQNMKWNRYKCMCEEKIHT